MDAHGRNQTVVREQCGDLLLRNVVRQVADVQRAIFLASTTAAATAGTTRRPTKTATWCVAALGPDATFAARRLGRKRAHRDRSATLQRSIERVACGCCFLGRSKRNEAKA